MKGMQFGLVSAIALLTAGAAHAGSLKDYHPYYLWSGFYAGINAGGAWSAKDAVGLTGTDTGSGGFGSELVDGGTPSHFDLGWSSALGGVQAGYNWQSGRLVFGLETDIQILDGNSGATVTTDLPTRVPITTNVERQLDTLGTVRARLGVTATERTLLYVTGGLAYGHTELTVGSVAPMAGPPRDVTGSTSGVNYGWTVGGGAEFALTNDISFKAEYLYYDLGGDNTTIGYNYGMQTSTLTAHDDNSGHIVRAGLNLKLDSREAEPMK